MSAKHDNAAPLSDVMMAMDVVDTLRHRQDLVLRELAGGERRQKLLERLRAIYQEQGIEVPDRILLEGVDALEQDRFVYVPRGGGIRRRLAELYVSRKRWGKWVLGLSIAFFLSLGAYQFIYLPGKARQAEAARLELTEKMPREMQGLFDTIFEETKVQTAVTRARALLDRGRSAIKEENRAEAEKALAGLRKIRDTLRREYTLRVVNRDGVRSGFFTFPEVNRNATNYYIVVEAIDGDGNALSLDIANEETGETENVSVWGVRVPESVYNAIGADKRDDGIIQKNVVGRKLFGYLDVRYLIPVLGGTVTRW